VESKAAMLMVFFLSVVALAASPGIKRTILTGGGKVHTIHYQLGQSTVLYFGQKPETVICGNNNYFHIEKIKEGLSIQPLSNFSTNLTVLNEHKRFLFFLTPGKSGQVDTFVDVHWVPESEERAVASRQSKEVVHDLGQKLRLGSVEVRLKREIRIGAAKRSILEFEVENRIKMLLKTAEIEVLATKAGRAVAHQVSVFEHDDLLPGQVVTGRLIVTGSDLRGVSFIANYHGESGEIPGGKH
jgi:hypothetical protein